MSRFVATILLLITALLWGFAFVAQKSATHLMGPFTFSAVRYALGAVVMLPLVVWEVRRRPPGGISRRDRLLTAILGVSFFLGVYLQQAGLMTTTVTNGGFLTGLYVLLVPLIALAVARQLPHPIVWLCMPIAVVGVFLLNGGHLDGFNAGDILVIFGSVFWAIQGIDDEPGQGDGARGHRAEIQGVLRQPQRRPAGTAQRPCALGW